MKFETPFTPFPDTIETDCNEQNVFYRAQIVPDDSMGTPWDEHDFHGPVSDWRNIDSKAPGERVLCTDRHSARFYDVQEAMQIAKRDGWGCEHEEHRTKGEIAACAVNSDFENLRAWCNNDWWWVGVVLSKHELEEDEDGEQTIINLDDNVDSLWGIESSDLA